MGRFLDFEGVDAVLFDCDGVLVDSEPASEWAWRGALRRYGVELGDFGSWVGTTDEAIAVRFAPESGVSPRELLEAASGLLEIRLEDEPLEVFADAADALRRVEAANLLTAVVSNSERWRLEAVLASAGMEGRFAVRVTSDDVDLPKPAPDMYLRASHLLGVNASRCLVIEDSPTGVAAAREAGMRVVAVDREVFDPPALEAATRIVRSLYDDPIRQ